jgi:hypothetical protein
MKGVLMRQRKKLHERVINYPDYAPADSIELISTEVSDLKKLIDDETALSAVLDIRRDFLDAIRSYEKKSITSPEIVLDLLEEIVIRPVTKKWLVYTLNDRKERKLVPRKNSDDMVYQTLVLAELPSVEFLSSEMPLVQGGSYLLIYGGGADALKTQSTQIRKLIEGLPISDILFWQLKQGEPATLFSVRAKIGNQGGTPVEFPNKEILDTILDSKKE